MRAVAAAGLAAALLAACVATRPVLEVTPGLLATGVQLGLDSADIRPGRALFLRDCGRCHAYPDLSDAPKEGWESLLVRMAAKAGSSPSDSVRVRAFVLSASLSPAGR